MRNFMACELVAVVHKNRLVLNCQLGEHMYWLMTKKDLPLRAVIFSRAVNLMILSAALFLVCKGISFFL